MYNKSYTVPGFLFRKRILTISSEYVELANSNGKKRMRLSKSEITDFTYSKVNMDSGGIMYGIKYTISIRGSSDDDVLKVEFVRYFETQKYSDYYSEVVAALNKYYFKDIVAAHLTTFHRQGELTVGKLHLSKMGVQVIGTGLNFVWSDMKIEEYPTYFAISKPNAPEFHIWLNYTDWYSNICYALITKFKKEISA